MVHEVKWSMKYYGQEGLWAIPRSHHRPHVFNYGGNFRIPRMVLSPKLVALGVGAPLHPYLRQVLEWYDLAPIQLSPNSYKLILALYILYRDLGFDAPSMPEVSYFFSIRPNRILAIIIL